MLRRASRPLLLLPLLAMTLLAGSGPSTTRVLFDGTSLDDWQPFDAGGSGSVEIEDGQMIIGSGESLTGVIYKKAAELPVTNYEITLMAKRVEGVDFFCGLTFPVGSVKTCATVVLGGWGGSVTGLSSIDGMDASENSTGHYRKFENDKWYAVRLRVTPENISVWVGPEKIIDADIAGRKIGVRPGPIEEFVPLSLTTFQTKAAIKDVKLTPLSPGEAKPAPAAAEKK